MADPDIHLYYTERGSGRPLILLHGNGEDGRYFENQLRYFSGKYRVIAVDSRGHGKTPRGTAPFTIRQFAEDLKQFMDEQKIERADLLGFSDGGNVAAVFAIKYPERTGALILNGANLNPRGMKLTVQLSVILEYFFMCICSVFSKKAERKREVLGLMVWDPNIDPHQLRKIKSRTLVITGTKDMIRDSHTDLIAKMIPNSIQITIKGDHFISLKHSEEFNEAVEQFLEGGTAV